MIGVRRGRKKGRERRGEKEKEKERKENFGVMVSFDLTQSLEQCVSCMVPGALRMVHAEIQFLHLDMVASLAPLPLLK